MPSAAMREVPMSKQVVESLTALGETEHVLWKDT